MHSKVHQIDAQVFNNKFSKPNKNSKAHDKPIEEAQVKSSSCFKIFSHLTQRRTHSYRRLQSLSSMKKSAAARKQNKKKSSTSNSKQIYPRQKLSFSHKETASKMQPSYRNSAAFSSQRQDLSAEFSEGFVHAQDKGPVPFRQRSPSNEGNPQIRKSIQFNIQAARVKIRQHIQSRSSVKEHRTQSITLRN
ncbi:hypothetical protein Droror1_Dr00015378 [Drosera rotundifolia]